MSLLSQFYPCDGGKLSYYSYDGTISGSSGRFTHNHGLNIADAAYTITNFVVGFNPGTGTASKVNLHGSGASYALPNGQVRDSALAVTQITTSPTSASIHAGGSGFSNISGSIRITY